MLTHRTIILACSFLAFLTAPLIGGSPFLTRDQAAAQLIYELDLNGAEDCIVRSPMEDFGFGPGFEGLLPKNTLIHPLANTPLLAGGLTLTGPAYFFFIDDQPRANFGKQTRFVFVDATLQAPTLANGGITVQIQSQPPVIACPGDEAWVWFQNPAARNGLILGEPQETEPQDPDQKGLEPKCKVRQSGPDNKDKTDIKKKDTDKDGKYDTCERKTDLGGDGKIDKCYKEEDMDEDGTPEKTTCVAYEDGVKKTKYDYEDNDDDGKSDKITCYKWENDAWVKTKETPKRSENSFRMDGGHGSQLGGEPFVLISEDITWENPRVTVFAGADAAEVSVLDPFHIAGLTQSYFAGTHNVLVADFDEDSPSYGFDELIGGITLDPVIDIDQLNPAEGPCNQFAEVEIRGVGFEPDVMVTTTDGEFIPVVWIDETTLMATLPPGPCGDDLDLSVWNPSSGPEGPVTTLIHAYSRLLDSDVTAPVLICPQAISMVAGENGWARLPNSFQAEAWDNSGKAGVYRLQAGPMEPGLHQVTFEAVDAAGNRTSCSVDVTVHPNPNSKSRERIRR